MSLLLHHCFHFPINSDQYDCVKAVNGQVQKLGLSLDVLFKDLNIAQTTM